MNNTKTLTNLQETIIIFGGPDHEASEARNVARRAGLQIADAITADGKLVHSGNAYQATSYKPETLETLIHPTQAIVFECSKVAAVDLQIVLHADHHNEGDTGYGVGADKFWEASSLGQLMNYLGMTPTQTQLYIAAGDHCPADAYAGRCPGIDPDTFAQLRITQKCDFYATDPRNSYKANPNTLSKIVDVAKAKLLTAPEVNGVRDLREMGNIDELPEAALATGMTYITQIPDTDRDRQPTGNLKILIGGHTTPSMVEEFMNWGKSLPNKVSVYGNPARGFAGVVVKPE